MNLQIFYKYATVISTSGSLIGDNGELFTEKVIKGCDDVIKSIEDSYIHPTVGYKVKDEECDLNYVPGEGIHGEVRVALSNSLGFGGHNATLAVKKFDA